MVNQAVFDKVRQALMSIGFKQEDIESQMKSLAALINLRFYERVIRENSHALLGKDLKAVDEFMFSHYTDEAMAKIASQTTNITVAQYKAAIIKGLPAAKAEAFNQMLVDAAEISKFDV